MLAVVRVAKAFKNNKYVFRRVGTVNRRKGVIIMILTSELEKREQKDVCSVKETMMSELRYNNLGVPHEYNKQIFRRTRPVP